MEEQFFSCPYCWETVSMLIDTSVEDQQYIEDCEVCCNPIQLTISIFEGEITRLEAESIEQ
jgi:hypothetical protein